MTKLLNISLVLYTAFVFASIALVELAQAAPSVANP